MSKSISTIKSSTHPKHTANRVAMAKRIVEFLDTDAIFSGANNSAVVTEFNDTTWALIASVMGEKQSPAEGTVATVIGILVGREMAR
jgi:hypothetical protein